MNDPTRRTALSALGAGLLGGLGGCLGGPGSGGTTVDPDAGPVLSPPALGADAESAAVTVAVWEDYRCPHCATFSLEVLPRVRERLLDGDVRVEFHDFPLPVDRWSWRVAMAGRSVQERAGVAAFWRFERRAFERQRAMDSTTTVREVAADAGADPETVAADLEAERHRPVVAADRQRGRDRGVSGTPTVSVADERVGNSYEAIADAIERAR